MSGMNKETGKLIKDDLEHLRQSIVDILTTPKGSRVLNREYGSDLFKLIDAPTNKHIDFYQAVADALTRWEPRFRHRKTTLKDKGNGAFEIDVIGDHIASGAQVMVTI